MKNELNSKKNQRTEPVTYLGRQVKSSAELVKMMKMKRENGIDAAHIIAEVQGSIRNQNMPSKNVGGTKASKAQMRAKKEDGSDVTQAEIFIETRTGQKGKEVDQDTQNVVEIHPTFEEGELEVEYEDDE
ncbi:hypothetical protein QL285_053354 [Trifolium repens]|nr:hypothetical protein QL285_053351 [Trifolium repens]KAK2403965.1 hypothetical protein QL285_053354 [Trifolium repens]